MFGSLIGTSMQNKSGAVAHAKLGGIQLCKRGALLFGLLKGSLHHEPQLAGVLALAAVIQEGFEPLAQVVRRGW